ncbi:retrovirus-related Pol polyprotein from transposon 17.6 [Trichonephila inaurata madagascariensis]|uniref:Retrovirus-related Pol polyprotein from transposon 17.6 n=1 Tax=Trichonephila inaurata madagascariensis TaxID=2747483 RepID=A0A8X6INW8_9ARAC|nr:retrovirus-related Pol polyprotein from transposon 17.6 [Trichonephila inaurata madagascariensis]
MTWTSLIRMVVSIQTLIYYQNTLSETIAENFDEIPAIAAIADYIKEQLKDKYLKSIIKTLEKGDGYQSNQIRSYVLYRRNYDSMGQQWLLVVTKQTPP